MEELPNCSVHLMVTSPPYNIGKEYDEDFYRVLVSGGRDCINIANLGRKPYIPLHAFISKDIFELGFLMRGEIIWNKGTSASPTLRDVHAYILVFSKGMFLRKNLDKRNGIVEGEFRGIS